MGVKITLKFVGNKSGLGFYNDPLCVALVVNCLEVIKPQELFGAELSAAGYLKTSQKMFVRY